MQSSDPIRASGTEYLREPQFGEIVRSAMWLDLIVMPDGSAASDAVMRETEQAEYPDRRDLAEDWRARLFAQIGYAHIDKAKGRLPGDSSWRLLTCR